MNYLCTCRCLHYSEYTESRGKPDEICPNSYTSANCKCITFVPACWNCHKPIEDHKETNRAYELHGKGKDGIKHKICIIWKVSYLIEQMGWSE